MAEILCEKCVGLCCRHIALPIEKPTSKSDYDDIRWYLAHEGISVFVEEGDWYINIASRCKYLNKDHLCDIYADRPKICRKYTEDSCDFHGGDYNYEMYFASTEEMDEYLKKRSRKKKKKKT